MNLPKGFRYRPRQAKLIDTSAGAQAWISIDTRRYPNNGGYQINDRQFQNAVSPYLRGDWEEFDLKFGLDRQAYGGVVYSGAEHRGDPKHPNLTLVPNLQTTHSQGLSRPWHVFGSTLGHYHPEPDPAAPDRVQEIYEFQSYGLMVIDRENGRPELYVAADGDKVAVPNRCHMTLYNLGDEDNPLVTLDFADPKHNPANKDLIQRCGPILLGYYDDLEAVFTLNRLYINGAAGAAGVRLLAGVGNLTQRQIRIPLGARMDLGPWLHRQFTSNPEVIARCAELGLRVVKATPEVCLSPLTACPGRRLFVDRPLIKAFAAKQDKDGPTRGTEGYRYFFPQTPPLLPGPAPANAQGIAAHAHQLADQKQHHIAVGVLNRPLQVVVEGSGDWVEKAYRPIFNQGPLQGKVAVYYADDTRWKGQPGWTTSLEPWEVYLDKSKPKDLAIYHNLIPDAVFVVTPDFTHAAIAMSWLGRGAPDLFIEKPFDSQLENVRRLQEARGVHSEERDVAVVGLDHYQVYAMALYENRDEIFNNHLGGALAKVVFRMTEPQPIEKGRERSLRYGLTLDMLPHLPGVLSYFGDVATIDDIRVVEAAQYAPLVAEGKTGQFCDIQQIFHNETASHLCFTFEDYSGNGHRVPCDAMIGKGVKGIVVGKDAKGGDVRVAPKYIELWGVNGNRVRVDFNNEPAVNHHPDYPWNQVFLIKSNEKPVADPYHPGQTLPIPNPPMLYPVQRDRYQRLVKHLVEGNEKSVAAGTLEFAEARDIVKAMERIWNAVQADRPWWNNPALRSQEVPSEGCCPQSDHVKDLNH